MDEYDSLFQQEYSRDESINICCAQHDWYAGIIDNSKSDVSVRLLNTTINLMERLTWMGLLKAYFRRRSTTGRISFLRNIRRRDQSTRLGPVQVLDVETTGYREE